MYEERNNFNRTCIVSLLSTVSDESTAIAVVNSVKTAVTEGFSLRFVVSREEVSIPWMGFNMF